MPINTSGVISAKLWIREGSRADPTHLKGLHQLLGSLLSRGCGPYNNISLADLVEGCGAGLRCDANEDGLIISLKCATTDISRLLPILGWMITEPHISPDQINLERELSLQILQRQKENPFHLAFEGWRHIAYNNGPYGHDPLGLQSDLKRMDKDELLPIAKGLKSRVAVLAVAGSFQSDLEEQIRQMEPFRKWSEDKESELNYSLSKDKFDKYKPLKKDLSLTYQSTEQVVIMLGQPTISHDHEDDLALRLLTCHLGVGMSSVLFRELREQNGVAYDVGIHHPTREWDNPFLLHASTTEDKALLSLQLLMGIWWKITSTKLSEPELILARAKFRGQLAHSSQTAGQRAERIAQLNGFNLDDEHDKRCLLKIDTITSKDLQAAAIRHLNSPLLSLCGPEKTLKHLSREWGKSYCR